MRVNLDPLVVTGKTSVWALLFASLALGLFTSIAMYKVGVPNVSLGSILLISGGWLVVLTNGVCVQKALAPALDDVDLTFALAVGIVCSSIVVLALTEIFQIPSAIGLMALCFFILFFVFFLRRHFTLRLSNLGLDALVVPCCITFVLVWCWSSLTSLGELPKKGTISMWTDIFVHATTILQYGDFWTSGRSSIELANTPRPLYHYGSYVLPAALFSAIDISGLQSAVAVHLPIGLLAMFAGTYALAKQITTPLRSKITALLSISLLFIAPDTSTYGLANGWFGVRWMLFSSPGSGYAVAAVLISLLFLNAWLNDRNYVALISAVVFAAMAFQLRVHMLLWYLPALILYVGSSCLKWIGSLGKHIGLYLIASIGALFFSNVGRYLWFVHVDNEPTQYPGIYAALVEGIGATLASPVGFLLLYPGMLGAFAIIYPVLLLMRQRFEKLDPMQWFPLVLAGVAGVAIIFAPAASNGDQFEYKHRAFVLLYVTTLIWTCDLAVKMSYQKFSALVAPLIIFLPVFACTALALFRTEQFMTADQPKFRWGHVYIDTPVSADLVAAANYVRLHGRPGDVAIILPINIKARAADNATRFASIANIPLYISRYTMWDSIIARDRLTMAERIGNSRSYEEFVTQMRSNGFRWLIFNQTSAPSFDPEFRLGKFKEGEWLVYSPE